jgi:hypothetical protein
MLSSSLPLRLDLKLRYKIIPLTLTHYCTLTAHTAQRLFGGMVFYVYTNRAFQIAGSTMAQITDLGQLLHLRLYRVHAPEHDALLRTAALAASSEAVSETCMNVHLYPKHAEFVSMVSRIVVGPSPADPIWRFKLNESDTIDMLAKYMRSTFPQATYFTAGQCGCFVAVPLDDDSVNNAILEARVAASRSLMEKAWRAHLSACRKGRVEEVCKYLENRTNVLGHVDPLTRVFYPSLAAACTASSSCVTTTVQAILDVLAQKYQKSEWRGTLKSDDDDDDALVYLMLLASEQKHAQVLLKALLRSREGKRTLLSKLRQLTWRCSHEVDDLADDDDVVARFINVVALAKVNAVTITEATILRYLNIVASGLDMEELTGKDAETVASFVVEGSWLLGDEHAALAAQVMRAVRPERIIFAWYGQIWQYLEGLLSCDGTVLCNNSSKSCSYAVAQTVAMCAWDRVRWAYKSAKASGIIDNEQLLAAVEAQHSTLAAMGMVCTDVLARGTGSWLPQGLVDKIALASYAAL